MLEIISRNEKAQPGLTRKQLLNRWTMRSANIELGDLVERYHYDYQEPAVTKITKIPNSSLNFPISVPFAVDLSEEVITQRGVFLGGHRKGAMREMAILNIQAIQKLRFQEPLPDNVSYLVRS